jgi:hypothetical protein
VSSAEDVQSDAATEAPDERLARAFDRAARLGIDIDRDHALSEREAAAVRAFAALDFDVAEADGGDPVPGAPGWDIAAPEASSPHASDPMGPDVPSVAPTIEALTPDPAMPGPPEQEPPVDSGPLRPDAVWHVRAYAKAAPLIRGTRRDAPAMVVDVPEAAGATTPPPPVGTADAVDAVDAVPVPRTVDQYVLDLLAVAIAAGAFVTPWAWMFVVAVGATVGVTLRSITDHGPGPAPLLARAARRALGWTNPRSLVWMPVIVCRTLVLATMLPGIVFAAWWVLDQGTYGTFVAARAAVWGYAPRTGAAIVCYMLVAGIGDARHRRAALVGRATGWLGPRVVVALAAMTVVTAALVLTLVPRAGGGRLTAHDGLGWAPPGVRSGVDRLRDDVVTSELQATANCLSDRQGVRWTVDYTEGNPSDDDDIARLTTDDRIPSPSEQVTAAAAVHNQLAPWVEGIELAAGDSVIVRLDRGLLPSGRPVVEPAPLIDAAVNGAEVLAGGAGGFEREEALRCASAPIP